MKKTILYCTDNQRVPADVFQAAQNQLRLANLPIVSVSQQPMNLGLNIHLAGLNSSIASYATQLITGLAYIQSGIVYIAEHDVLYHPSHFNIIPEHPNMGYFDENCWYGILSSNQFANRPSSGPFGARALSMLVAEASFLLRHLSQLAELIWAGQKFQITPWNCTTMASAEFPSIDVRHGQNYTRQKERHSTTFVDLLPPWGSLQEAISCRLVPD